MSYCEKTKRQNHSLLNDTRTHNLRVKPGNFDLIDRKSGQRIEHTLTMKNFRYVTPFKINAYISLN
jgi:hypothetical protein